MMTLKESKFLRAMPLDLAFSRQAIDAAILADEEKAKKDIIEAPWEGSKGPLTLQEFEACLAKASKHQAS